jgi:hypothetical protein
MGTRKRHANQASMWVATQDLPRSAAHPFYARLNQILDGQDFDGFVEGLCERFYAAEGRPGLPPGGAALLVGAMATCAARLNAQTSGTPERFTALAASTDTSRTAQIEIAVDRWSTPAERAKLVETLRTQGPDKLLSVLQSLRKVGFLRQTSSIGWDLRYAHKEAIPDGGGERVVVATDRPVSNWEAQSTTNDRLPLYGHRASHQCEWRRRRQDDLRHQDYRGQKDWIDRARKLGDQPGLAPRRTPRSGDTLRRKRSICAYVPPRRRTRPRHRDGTAEARQGGSPPDGRGSPAPAPLVRRVISHGTL